MARVYRRTDAGTLALHSPLITLSAEMYRVLQAVEGDAHADTIRGRARDLPDLTVAETLAHLEAFCFLRSEAAKLDSDLDFTRHFRVRFAS